jgi:hypothetical protein
MFNWIGLLIDFSLFVILPIVVGTTIFSIILYKYMIKKGKE